jgi:hypothetical protein
MARDLSWLREAEQVFFVPPGPITKEHAYRGMLQEQKLAKRLNIPTLSSGVKPAGRLGRGFHRPISADLWLDMDRTVLAIGKQPKLAEKFMPRVIAHGGRRANAAIRLSNFWLKPNAEVNTELLDWAKHMKSRGVTIHGYTDRMPSQASKTWSSLGEYGSIFDEIIHAGGEKTKINLGSRPIVVDDAAHILEAARKQNPFVRTVRTNWVGAEGPFAKGVLKARGRGFKTAAILRRFM